MFLHLASYNQGYFPRKHIRLHSTLNDLFMSTLALFKYNYTGTCPHKREGPTPDLVAVGAKDRLQYTLNKAVQETMSCRAILLNPAHNVLHVPTIWHRSHKPYNLKI